MHWKRTIDKRHLAEIFRLGIPIGFSSIGEVGVYLVSTVIISLFGAAALAAHAITLRMAGVVYALTLGLSQAATVRVGHEIERVISGLNFFLILSDFSNFGALSGTWHFAYLIF